MIKDPNSWTVTISGDLELNFLIYVAGSFGLLEPEAKVWSSKVISYDECNFSKLRYQWNKYWYQIILEKANIKHLIGFPNFDTLESDLRMACEKVWESYIEWWNMPAGGQNAMLYWETKPQISKYILEFERTTGRPINTFNMKIDLVYAGINKPIEVSDEYVIMPIGCEYLLKKEWWMDRFKERY